MIRKLYTITRDAILGLAELPALHSLAEEAKSEAIDRQARAITEEQARQVMLITEYSKAKIAAVEKERDELKAQLARHVEAERWHQVTAGEGELPPEGVEVIGRFSEHSGMFIAKVRPERDGIKTYQWRYASSKYTPNG